MSVTTVKISNNSAVAVPKNEELAATHVIAKKVLETDIVQDKGKEQQKMTRDDAVELTKIMDDISRMFNSQLSFKVHEESERLYVQFVDRTTGEVIKQLPPEELLELSAEIQKMVGLILDKYA